jgi:hypothetical protein
MTLGGCGGGGSRMPTYRLGPPTAVQLGRGGGGVGLSSLLGEYTVYIQDSSATQQKSVPSLLSGSETTT